MAKKVLSVLWGITIGLVVSFVGVQARTPENNQYPALLQVTAVQGLGYDDASDLKEGYLVCLKNQHGFVYRVHIDCGDFTVGEFYSCIMDDAGTEKIMDDTVIKMYYTRVDLF